MNGRDIFFSIVIIILLYDRCNKSESITTLSNNNEALTTELGNKNNSLSSANTELVSKQANIETLLSNLNTEREQHNNNSKTLNTQIDTLKFRVTELRKKLLEPPTNTDLRQYYDKMKYFETMLATSEQKLAIEVKARQDLENKIINLENLNKRLSSALSQIFKNTKAINDELRGIDNNINKFSVGAQKFDIAKETNNNVNNIKQKLDESQAEIEAFAEQFEWAKAVQSEFNQLRQDLHNKENAIKQYDTEFNKVYYFVGSTQQLLDAGLITQHQEGGIFKKKKIVYEPQMGRIDKSKCYYTDKRKLDLNIPTSSEIIKIHPNVDNDNFNISNVQGQPSVRGIKIYDNRKFWNTDVIIIQTN